MNWVEKNDNLMNLNDCFCPGGSFFFLADRHAVSIKSCREMMLLAFVRELLRRKSDGGIVPLPVIIFCCSILCKIRLYQ